MIVRQSENIGYKSTFAFVFEALKRKVKRYWHGRSWQRAASESKISDCCWSVFATDRPRSEAVPAFVTSRIRKYGVIACDWLSAYPLCCMCLRKRIVSMLLLYRGSDWFCHAASLRTRICVWLSVSQPTVTVTFRDDGSLIHCGRLPFWLLQQSCTQTVVLACKVFTAGSNDAVRGGSSKYLGWILLCYREFVLTWGNGGLGCDVSKAAVTALFGLLLNVCRCCYCAIWPVTERL